MIHALVLSFALAGNVDAPPKLVILDFSTTWCGPCRAMKPAIATLKAKGYPIREVDGDAQPGIVSHYKITAYPTLVLIDRANGDVEIKRTSQARSVGEIAAWFAEENGAITPPKPSASPNAARPPPETIDSPHPKPWQTVVRVRVVDRRSTGFGSGTIIWSDANEAIILTCAHIFKLDGPKQAKPDKFPKAIKIDLFDGELSGRNKSG